MTPASHALTSTVPDMTREQCRAAIEDAGDEVTR